VKNQTWLLAVGSGIEPLPNRWVVERPELLSRWPVGKKMPGGVKSGDLLIYYAAKHQRLIAIARASGDGSSASDGLPVQVKLAIPTIQLAPDWRVLGKPAEAIEGQRAILLTDEEYERGCEALTAGIRLH
jgi:hypothetical protein